MTTDTLTLTDFLLTRIAETEDGWGEAAAHDRAHSNCAEHILATCKAHRAIVEPWASGDGAKILDLWSRSPELDPPIEVNNAIVVLRALASIYADHADFRSEWAL